MDEKIISNPDENPYSIEVKNFDTDKTKWEIQKGIVEPSKELPLPNELGELKYILEAGTEDLDKVLRLSTTKILNLMHNRHFPFDDSVINDYYQDYLELTKK